MSKELLIDLIERFGNQVSSHPSFDMNEWAERLLTAFEKSGMKINEETK